MFLFALHALLLFSLVFSSLRGNCEVSTDKPKKIAVLICQKFSSVATHVDNKELIVPFTQHGLEYEEVIWDDPQVDFTRFEAVLVRATWDYIDKREQFLERMQAIDRLGIRLFNDLATLEWNSKKDYLFEFEAKGIHIAKTVLVRRDTTPDLANVLESLSTDQYVIKPIVSGGAHRTFLTTNQDIQQIYETAYRADEEVLIQPFIPEVATEGEFSLMFFDGEFSHAVLSTPKAGDFRVQRMHGAKVAPVKPSSDMIAEAKKVITFVPGSVPLYARVDFVRHSGAYLLMELEAIEPGLFLQFDSPSGAERFACALAKRLQTKSAH